jgi:hypothetical protein
MSEAQAIHESSLHFDLAVRRAFFHDVLAFFRRRSNDLLPYHEISQRTAPEGESYRGQQTVRLDQIIGSVNRFEEFDRSFMPRRRHARRRWASIDRAWHDGVILPPVQLIQVGDIYFVKDGNHRVSVARQHGQEFIDAVVVEERLRAPLLPAMSANELILQAEYAELLRRTNLDGLRPEHNIHSGTAGGYEELWRHIEAHRRWMEETSEGREVALAEAVTDWYDRVYTPLLEVSRERGVCRSVLERAGADVYLWLMSRRDDLYARLRRTCDPMRAADAHIREMVDAKKRATGPLSWLLPSPR